MSKAKFWSTVPIFGMFFILFIALPISKIYQGEGDFMMVSISFCGALIMLTLLLIQFNSWRHRDYIVLVKNNKLTHYANLKFSKSPIDLDNLKNIYVSNRGKRRQIELNYFSNSHSMKGLKNQLSGKTHYITDNVIDSKDFDELILFLNEVISNNRNNK